MAYVDADRIAYGQRLRNARLEKGLTQERVARMIGVTSQVVWRWESGWSKPSRKHVPAVAAAYGLPIEFLLGEFQPENTTGELALSNRVSEPEHPRQGTPASNDSAPRSPWAEPGMRLKQARNRAGLSQTAVAKALRVNPQTVWYWEAGRYLPSGPNLRKLASLLKVSTDWILGQQEQEDAASELQSALQNLDQAQIEALRQLIATLQQSPGGAPRAGQSEREGAAPS